MSGLKIGSLFSGYLGLDMAVEAVTGAKTAWVSDIDKGACKILAHRTDAPNLGDLTRIDWSTVEPVDIITGGFPCQDLSHAGKRAGMADGTRSGLWSYMCEAIRIIRPRLVVAENVRGLLSAEALRPVEPCTWCVGGKPEFDVRALGAVLGDLADIGYVGRWHGLFAGRSVPIDNFTHVGASHGRFRVFLVAHPAGDGWDEGWPESAGLVGRSDAAERGRSDVALLPSARTSDTNGAGLHGDGGMDLRTAVTLLPTPAVNDMGRAYTPEEWDAWTAKMKAAHSNGNGHGKSLEIEAARLLPTPSVADVQGGRKARSGARSDELLLNGLAAAQQFGQYAAAIARWESAIGRPAPAPTEPTGKGGAHRLSARFCEWLMGLPDGWITDVPGITRNEALKACGNGVVPAQAEAALRHLLATREVAA